MNRTVVLLDTQSARIFHLGDRKPETLKFGHPDHHTHRKDQGDAASHPFYEEIAAHLKDADEVLVLGHRLVHVHLKTHLEGHHALLAKKVKGYETVDAPTDGQVIALASAFFEKHP